MAQPPSHDAHLDALEEAVNKRIDTEVSTLLDNFKEIITLSHIADKDHFVADHDAFQAEGCADSMVRAAQSLYLLSDSLKLSLLLSQSQASEARDNEARQLIAETERHKHATSELLAQHWLAGAHSAPADDTAEQSPDNMSLFSASDSAVQTT